jgi:hypothetical protein
MWGGPKIECFKYRLSKESTFIMEQLLSSHDYGLLRCEPCNLIYIITCPGFRDE